MSEKLYDFDGCLRCGLPEDHQRHHPEQKPPQGWHPFRGQTYLDEIEDALLFVREHPSAHDWRRTGLTICTSPSFSEQRCRRCGGINWGGKNDGICLGLNSAEAAVTAAHNRRAFRLSEQRRAAANAESQKS